MKLKIPKNDRKYLWTQHVIRKMSYYGLSADRVKRIINHPKRTENGVAPNTVAIMQCTGTKKKATEIWAMYQKKPEGRKIIITTWRYPGTSPVREAVPIPTDILAELKRGGIL
jgi:hypothetical protein